MESKYKSKVDIRDYLEGKALNDQSIREACISEDELVKVLRMTKRHVVKLRQRGKLPASVYYRRKWWFPRVEIAKFLETRTSAEEPSEQNEQNHL